MKIPVLIFLFLLSNFTSAYATAAVTVAVNNEQFRFDPLPRLVEVLAPIANTQNWYWPSAALYQVNNEELENTRQILINKLSTLSQTYKTDKPEISLSLEQLKTTISSWRLAKRLPVKIDYDLARIVTSSNPQLQDGNYILQLEERKNTIQMFGAIYKSRQVTHLGHSDVSHYLTDILTTDLANNDSVILIQADGRTIKAPVAYWNKNHQEVMPGSQLFIPLKESLFQPEFSTINKFIVTLALNRVQ